MISVKHEELLLQGTSERASLLKTVSPMKGNSKAQKAKAAKFTSKGDGPFRQVLALVQKVVGYKRAWFGALLRLDSIVALRGYSLSFAIRCVFVDSDQFSRKQ